MPRSGGVRVASIVLFCIAVVVVIVVAVAMLDVGQCRTRACTRFSPDNFIARKGGGGNGGGAACPDLKAKALWWKTQAGTGTVQGPDPGSLGWEGDSGQDGRPVDKSRGCVVAGATQKGGAPLPGTGQVLPVGKVWPDGATEPQDLCQVEGRSGPCTRGIGLTGLNATQQALVDRLKGVKRSTRPPRLALYHGGVVGRAQIDFNVFKLYMGDVVRFVASKGINRVFFVLTPWSANNQPYMADPQNIVTALVEPLYRAWKASPGSWIDGERPSVGIVPYLRPKDAQYDVQLKPGDPPLVGGVCGVCQTASQCAGRTVDTGLLAAAPDDCPSSQYQQWVPTTTKRAPGCPAPCSINPAGECVGCDSKQNCPDGCPDTGDQVMAYIAQVNRAIRATLPAGEADHFVISNIVADGEDAGQYQTDWGLTSLAQSGWRRRASAGAAGAATAGPATTDVVNIGIAKGLQTTPSAGLRKVQAQDGVLGPTVQPSATSQGAGQWTYYPETYWYENSTYPCSGNPYQLANSWSGDGTSTVPATRSTICTLDLSYREFAREFRGQRTKVRSTATAPMAETDTASLPYLFLRYQLAVNDGSLDPVRYHGGDWEEEMRGIDQLAHNVRDPDPTKGIVPMLSIENLSATRAANGTAGMPGDPTKDCLALAYFGKDAEPKPDLCGTADFFSYWDWDSFLQFTWLLSDYLRDDGERGWMGIYESQFIPSDWMPDVPGKPDQKWTSLDNYWDDYWRFSPDCSATGYQCGQNGSDPDAECRAYAGDPAVLAKLEQCHGPGNVFDLDAFKHCRYDKSKPQGTAFFCPVGDEFRCKSGADCSGHGDCVGGTCRCRDNYTGVDCSVAPFDCLGADKCLNGGVCTPDAKGGPPTCVCDNEPGSTEWHTGPRCEVAFDPTKHPCFARCADPTNQLKCGLYCGVVADDPDGYCVTKSGDLSATCYKTTESCCKSCATDADCGNSALVCDSGFCIKKGTPGPPAPPAPGPPAPGPPAPSQTCVAHCAANLGSCNQFCQRVTGNPATYCQAHGGTCKDHDSQPCCQACRSDTDCSKGTACRSGFCQVGTAPSPPTPPTPPSPPAQSCQARCAADPQGCLAYCKAATGDQASYCQNGTTCHGTTAPCCKACTADSQCPGGTSCTSGYCAATQVDCPSTCAADPAGCDDFCQAVAGQACQNGNVCHGTGISCCTQCSTDADCPSPSVCSGGLCRAAKASGAALYHAADDQDYARITFETDL